MPNNAAKHFGCVGFCLTLTSVDGSVFGATGLDSDIDGVADNAYLTVETLNLILAQMASAVHKMLRRGYVCLMMSMS